jgi:hypothetical protein
MQLQPGQDNLAKLESRPERVDLGSCTVSGAEGVELVMTVVDWNGVVGLEGRPRLRLEVQSRGERQNTSGETYALFHLTNACFLIKDHLRTSTRPWNYCGFPPAGGGAGAAPAFPSPVSFPTSCPS